MKFAIILSGCGQFDGSETQETVLTLLALALEGVQWDAFAPLMEQHDVTNHLTQAIEPHARRSVLEESARLVRGHIAPLSQADPSIYDAIIFPGGMGAVKNLSNWIDEGDSFSLQKDVAHFTEKASQLKIPMGFICIAPLLMTKIFPSARLTLGHDSAITAWIKGQGFHHVVCEACDVVIDEQHNAVSTPANMLPATIDEVFQGIRKLVLEIKVLAALRHGSLRPS